jgi:hypothetical protein
MEIKILAQNLHVPLASSSEQDLNLGQSSKMRFYWPLDFHLCYHQAETMEHLLNNCPLSEEIWNQATQLMRRTKRVKNNIISTIRDWGPWFFQNSYPEQNLETLTRLHSLATMEREEQKNFSFPALPAHPPLVYNPLASPGNSSATIVDPGRLPH